MAFTNKLRPRKHLLECKVYGTIGGVEMDGVAWKDIPYEVLLAHYNDPNVSQKSKKKELIGAPEAPLTPKQLKAKKDLETN